MENFRFSHIRDAHHVLGLCHATRSYDSVSTGLRLLNMDKNAPKSEVIQEWADLDANGASFERGRMEANIQSICFIDPAGVPEWMKDRHKGVKVRHADVASLVRAAQVDLHTDIGVTRRAGSS